MKDEDLGIDPKTGIHNRNLTHWETKFLGVLWDDHSGEACPISADELAVRFDLALKGWDTSDEDVQKLVRHVKRHPNLIDPTKRDVRYTHNHLLNKHDIPIYSKAGIGGGYYIGENEDEGDKFFEAFRKRALTGMRKGSRGKKALMRKGMVQLMFDFEEMLEDVDQTPFIRRRAPLPELVDVADALIERMMLHPEKYADGLRKIGTKYSSVFLPRKDAQAIKLKATELLEAVAGLGV